MKSAILASRCIRGFCVEGDRDEHPSPFPKLRKRVDMEVLYPAVNP